MHLFTTFAVRAINLEWVADLIAGQFLNCMRRLVSHRVKPDLIISDKTPQFKLVKTTLTDVILVKDNNVPRAAWKLGRYQI